MRALAFREATTGDLTLVIDSLLDSYRTAHAAGLIQMDDWREVMWPQVEKLLGRAGVRVIAAYRPGASVGADVYGWIAVESGDPLMVIYCYVKESYRKMGIARRLLREAGLDAGDRFDYAAKTAVVSKLRTKIPLARWSPLRARFRPKTPSPAGAR